MGVVKLCSYECFSVAFYFFPNITCFACAAVSSNLPNKLILLQITN